MSAADPLQQSALYAVRGWPLRRHLEVLLEDALYGPLGPEELRTKIALGGLDLAVGELVAAYATDRERRRHAAEVLCGAAIRAILSPFSEASPEALRHLELARRGFSAQGIAWGGFMRLADAARDASVSRAERAAAGAALWSSHLALGDSPGEAARMAALALAEAFAAEHAPEALAITLAHLERKLADREIEASQLAGLARS